MFFRNKPLIYLQLYNQSLRYMAVHAKNHTVLEYDEIFFESNMIEDGVVVNRSLLETRLSALVQEKKWKNAKASLLVLNDFVTVRDIDVPNQLEEDEIRDYLNLHMNQTIRMPFDQPSFDYKIVDETDEVHQLVLMAYPREMALEYQEILQNVSLKPDVADVAALSLYRVADSLLLIPQEKNAHTMVLQWNPFDLSITVFNQERPTFNRHSQNDAMQNSYEHTMQGEWIWTESEAELELNLEEQLNSLERFLDFYRYSVLDGQEGISKVILTGAYPNLEDIKWRISERFELPVELLELPYGINPTYSALYGLILRDEKNPNGKPRQKRGRKK